MTIQCISPMLGWYALTIWSNCHLWFLSNCTDNIFKIIIILSMSKVKRSHAWLLYPENIEIFAIYRFWALTRTTFSWLVVVIYSFTALVQTTFSSNSPNVKVKGQNDHTVHRSHVRLYIVSEYWPEQNLQGEGHDFKAKGQMVKITLQCTGSM